jgi:hypothetical protein
MPIPTRVILASNTNPEYIQFWPLVARHWKLVHGITPTLFFLGPEDRPVDKTCGDVIFVEPWPGIPTSFQAQIIRLFAPSLFSEDCCIICDIDLLLLDANFFQGIRDLPENVWISLNRYPPRIPYVSLSYQIAMGKTFREVFRCSGTLADIRDKVKTHAGGNLSWITDELVLSAALQKWAGTGANQRWKKIHTPGIWGGKAAIRSVTRFFHCWFQPARVSTLQELEPFRPLYKNLPLVKRVLQLRNPEFPFPVLEGFYAGDPQLEASRHPHDRNKGTRALIVRRPFPESLFRNALHQTKPV